MINIANNGIKFNDLEEKMWKKKMQEGLEELREQLRVIDNQLLKDKNNTSLEVKDFQKTTIKCILTYISIPIAEPKSNDRNMTESPGRPHSSHCGARRSSRVDRMIWVLVWPSFWNRLMRCSS